MNNFSTFNQEPYDEQKVEAIRVRLENYAAIGTPIEYQVFINGEEIVPKTNDATRFTSFYDLLNENSKTVTINEFYTNSRHKKTRHFFIAQHNETIPSSVNGFDPRAEVAKQFNEFKLDYINKELEKDVKVLKDEIVKLEEAKKKAEDELSETKEDLKKLMAEQSLGTQIIGTLREFMPHSKHHQTLTGANETQEKKSGVTEETVVLTKQDYANYQLFDQFMSKFSKVELGQVMNLIEQFSNQKELIAQTLQFIYSKNSAE